jgi:hypothetical protein
MSFVTVLRGAYADIVERADGIEEAKPQTLSSCSTASTWNYRYPTR